MLSEERWRAVHSLSRRNVHALEEMQQDLADFQQTRAQLASWLAQKDKMVTVLGPLATEPAMIRTQLEQVQVGCFQSDECLLEI